MRTALPGQCLGESCGPKGIGSSCKQDAECDSKHCADGVCCSTACGGACQSCDMVGSVGTCMPTPAGQPHRLCPKQDPTTCGTTGMCDGQGGCPRYPVNTACGAAVCVDGTSGKSTQTCDGLGTCLHRQDLQLRKLRLRARRLHQLLFQQRRLRAGHNCTIPTGSTVGTCGLKVPGQSCTADADCMSAHCADGVCCATTCTGPVAAARSRLAGDLHADRRRGGGSACGLQGPDGRDVLDGRQVRWPDGLPKVCGGHGLRARELLGEQLHAALDLQRLRHLHAARRHQLQPVPVQRHLRLLCACSMTSSACRPTPAE
jgi:hypothetical protein